MPKFQPIVIKPEASPSDIAFIESHRADIPVLEMLMVHRRRYPHGDMLASAIGYVGEVSAEQVEASDSNLKPGDIVGKTGLERQYNDTLMGTDGLRRVIVNSIGKEVGPPRTAGRHSGKADPTDDRLRLAGRCGSRYGRQRRRRGRHGRTHRRSPGDGQPAHVRPQ